MQFSRDGDWYQVIRITGPSHNLLALKFSEVGASSLTVEQLSVSNEVPAIDAEGVQRQVLDGISEANAQLGTNYQVVAIRFVATDTPSPSAYRSLTKVIVEQLAREGTFAAT